jgi:hypothetical protein
VRSQNDDATNTTSDRPPRKPKRGPLPARLAGMRPDASPRLKVVETLKAEPPPRKGPRTTAGRIKHDEAKRPPASKGAREHALAWPRGPPSEGPLGLFLQFSDLKSANLIVSYCGLKTLIKNHGFPPGRYLGRSTRVWSIAEVKRWLADRPTTRPPRELAEDGDE